MQELLKLFQLNWKCTSTKRAATEEGESAVLAKCTLRGKSEIRRNV
jgi:hypothetical protein